MGLNKKKTIWRHVSEFEIFQNGDCFFPQLLSACQAAQESIHISLYWFESGTVANEFIDVFLQARSRGVVVTLLLDRIGSYDLNAADQARLIEAGVIMSWYNPIQLHNLHLIFQRDHSKLFIIDRSTLFIGGTGIADIFSASHSSQSWRENMFRIQGSIIEDALAALLKKWKSSKTKLHEKTPRDFNVNALSQSFTYYQPQGILLESRNALWLESRSTSQRSILKEIIHRIKQSQREITLVTAYFAPSARLRYALKKAAKRGGKVKLLVPGIESDHPIFIRAGQYYYNGLLKHGVQIFEFRKSFMHTKLVICDDFICIGSSNLDIYTQRWSLEANVALLESRYADKVKAMIETDINYSEAIEVDTWSSRHLGVKALNFMAYLISIWGNNLARQIVLAGRYFKT